MPGNALVSFYVISQFLMLIILKIQTLTSPPSVLLRVLQVRSGAEVAKPGAARDARHRRLERGRQEVLADVLLARVAPPLHQVRRGPARRQRIRRAGPGLGVSGSDGQVLGSYI
jgi:hypothetical protein